MPKTLPTPKTQRDTRTKRPSVMRLGYGAAALVLIGTIAAISVWRPPSQATASSTPNLVKTEKPNRAPVPLNRFGLLAMSPDELARVDIAAINLACADGLPGFEGIDSAAVLAKLDEWAAKVKFETERHLYRVKDPKYAEHYRHSESYLRAEFLIMVLQEDCGVRYNPDRIYTPNFADSRDQFIHGMLDPKCGGTCASMPVLYTAIGRRTAQFTMK
ncbi:MAG: hypothetical protein U0570_13735 [Phycisphaerales bacterium]